MSAALLIHTRKEVRALLPWTVGVAIGSAAIATMANGHAGSPDYRELQMLFMMAYALGVLAVGALSVGQEVTHGTLAALLAQPLDRLRILRLKLGVLAVALAGLGLIANAMFPEGYLPDDGVRRLIVWGPVAAGIGLAPLLTVLTRRPLGGVVFSLTIPGFVLMIATRLYPLHLGSQAWSITWYGTLILSAVSLAALFVHFPNLEVAGDGRSHAGPSAAPMMSDAAVTYSPTNRRPWIWLLVKKELRLQQMTFAVSGLYVLAAVASMILAAKNAPYLYPTFGPLSIIHAYCIPVLAGAVASAEERHLGTLAGQLLQPRDMRVQWAVKTVVTIGIALLLTFGLPALLMAIHRPADGTFRVETDLMLGVGLLCAAAMWVSSLSGNALWALLGTVPIIGLAGMLGGAAFQFLRIRTGNWFSHHWDQLRWRLLEQAQEAANHPREWLKPFWQASLGMQSSLHLIEVSLIVGFGVLVLSFAARNHRTLDRNVGRIAWQVLIAAVFAAAATTGFLALSRMSYSWMSW